MSDKLGRKINESFDKYLEKMGAITLTEAANGSNINEAKRSMAKRKAPRPKRGAKSPADLARELERGTIGEGYKRMNEDTSSQEQLLRCLNRSLKHKIPLLIRTSPGAGVDNIIKSWAKETGLPVEYINCPSLDESDLGGALNAGRDGKATRLDGTIKFNPNSIVILSEYSRAPIGVRQTLLGKIYDAAESKNGPCIIATVPGSMYSDLNRAETSVFSVLDLSGKYGRDFRRGDSDLGGKISANESYLKEANRYDTEVEKAIRDGFKRVPGIDKFHDVDRLVRNVKRSRRTADNGERAQIDRRSSEGGHNSYSLYDKYARDDDLANIGSNNRYKYNSSSRHRGVEANPWEEDWDEDDGAYGYYGESLNESAISFEDLKNTVSDALQNIVYKYMHETGTVVSKEDLEKAIQFFENTFWSDPDAVYESLLNEKLPHDLVSNMARYSDMDLENAEGQEISKEQLQAIKNRDRYALKNVYVLLSDTDPKTGKKSIPYLQYNKQRHGEPVKYFYTYIPPYDLTNPEEAKRRGYERHHNDLLRTNDQRGERAHIDKMSSEEGHSPEWELIPKRIRKDRVNHIDANNNHKFNTSSTGKHLRR